MGPIFPAWLIAHGPGPACLVAAAAGVLSHVLYFIRGFKDRQTVGILAFYLVTEMGVALASVISFGWLSGVAFTAAVSASYFAALFSNMVVYRIFFHPLSRFPGPLIAKISKLYNICISQHLQEHQNSWVEKYQSPIIRVAPNELLIVSIDALHKIHGPQARTSKDKTFYELLSYHGERNLDSIADREEHRWRRQVWDRALGTKALEGYEFHAREVCHVWLAKIASESAAGRSLDTSLYAMLIPFDNMGRVGYSVDFGTVAAGREDRMLHLIETTFAAVGKVGQLGWPVVLSQDLKLSPEQAEFEALAARLAEEREEKNDETKHDIMKYLLEDYKSAKPKSFHNRDILHADSQIIMIGGTDTIASALSRCFYWLAKDAALRARLRDQLAPAMGKSIPGEFVHADVAAAVPLLDAVIDETMRLDAAVGNNGARSTPPEGVVVDGQFIPGGVTVFVGMHAMHRSPKFFKQPDEFIPERWTTRPDLVLDKRAFHPFLIGPFNCVGKRLALMVLRLVLAYTVWHYDFEFAPGEDGTRVSAESRNQLIVRAGPCECVFTRKERVGGVETA